MLLLSCGSSMALKLLQGRTIDIMMLRHKMRLHWNRSVIAEFLRHLIQSQAAISMQIIVGVLLFTPLVFLLPTTAVYYALALLLHTAVLAACRGLEVLVQLGQTIPLYTLWCWAVKPGMMPGELTCCICVSLRNHCAAVPYLTQR